jgi:hypothetical protein
MKVGDPGARSLEPGALNRRRDAGGRNRGPGAGGVRHEGGVRRWLSEVGGRGAKGEGRPASYASREVRDTRCDEVVQGVMSELRTG